MHSLAVIRVRPPRLTHSLHITLHPSHASSPFLRLTRQPTGGVERRRGCGYRFCRRWCCWCWSNFNPRHNLATRVHTTHLFWSFSPSLQRSCWSHPLPKPNPPSPGHPGSSQHCPLQISHSRLGTPAHPVQPSLIWALLAILDSFPDTCTRRDTEIIAKLRQQALQSFPTVFCCPSSRVSNSTLFPHPFKTRLSSYSFHPPHCSARHTLAACLPPATQPRQTLRLTHTVTQVFCVSDLRHGLITLVSAFDLGWTDLLTLESFFSRA